MTYRRGAHDELHQSVDAFEVALRELAWDLAARVIADELSRRPAANRRTGRRAAIIADETASDAPAPDAAAIAAIGTLPAPEGKRIKWTRERVIAELCEWLISGIVEPAFLRRHGKPGLVTAATRIFGRFDSALNVANLYLAKQYPDGPPAKRTAAPARAPRLPRSDASASGGAESPSGANGANGTNGNGAASSTAPASAAPDAMPGAMPDAVPGAVSEIIAAHDARPTSE